MAGYKVSAQARADMDALAGFIYRDDPVRAVSFLRELAAKFPTIGERPKTFPARDDLASGLRAARHGRDLFFFRCDGDDVDIIRVLHSARNLDEIFGDEGEPDL